MAFAATVKVQFSTTINAPREKVWKTMLAPETYKKWVNAAWPGSYYQGEWKKGANLKFLSPGQGGTLANLAEFRPYDSILANHIAALDRHGNEDRESDVAKGWIGTTERYTFTEQNGSTELHVEMVTSPDWESMFRDSWPKALKALKELSEK